jgi:DnaJ-class molecular chaperone
MGGRQQAPLRRGSDIEKEITIPFATSVVGGQHQVSLQRTKSKVDKIDVKIPAGIEAGKKIRLKGQGQSVGGPAGDLLIAVKIAPHPNYARKGLNLQITLPITLREAAAGATIDLPTPHGTVALKVPAGTSSGKSLRLKGMGVKAANRSGDLIAILQIAIPTEIPASDVENISELSEAWDQCAVRSELTW